MESLLDIRYPPYTDAKRKKFASMSELKPNFDREGRSIGWFGWFASLLGVKSVAAVISK